jgi:hypothetical protein
MSIFPTRKTIDKEFLCYIEEILTNAVVEYDEESVVSCATVDNLEEIRDTVREMLDEQEEE